jgi:hypothetical protein
MRTLRLKACKRCAGDLLMTQAVDDFYWRCLQCGRDTQVVGLTKVTSGTAA